MAFGNYYPGYQPMYGNGGAMPDTLGQFRAPYQPLAQQPAPQSQASNGLLWVQGEAGAKSFCVAPGQNVLLMDSEAQRFYIKSADASGMPLPLRIFEYKEITVQATEAHKQDTRYVTYDEFNELKANLSKFIDKQEDKADE